MNRIRLLLKTWRYHLNREGKLGLALLVISLLAYKTLLSPLYSQQRHLQQDIKALTSQTQTSMKHSRATPSTSAEELVAYYKFFPPQTSSPEWLQKIFAAARLQHLDLPEGKYRFIHERAGNLMRYEITLPVTGNYKNLHQFIAVVLNEVPIAALDGITFERSKINNDLIDAKINISLYLGQKS